MNYSQPGFSVQGIIQARILEWVAISFSRGSSQPRIEPRSPAFQVDSLPSDLPGKPMFSTRGSKYEREGERTWEVKKGMYTIN